MGKLVRRPLPYLAAIIASLFITAQVSLADTPLIKLRHPHNINGDEFYARRTLYIIELLDLAVKKSGHKFQLEAVPIHTITASRNVRNLKSRVYDINWIHTDKEREKTLLPIRIPLFKGLIGWRIMLTNSESRETLGKLNNIDELKKLIGGQGHDWPDTRILQHHEFTLLTTSSRDSLIQMLVGKRIDYFPRGVVEIWDESDLASHSDIFVDTNIALNYPTAYYFFVRKTDVELANIIESGLNAAISDGSFNSLFNRYYGNKIRRSKLDNRKIFRIDNPALSDETPLKRKELWFTPDTNTQ